MTDDDAVTPELVLPPGWSVDPLVDDRLRRLLAEAPAEVAGLAAPATVLAPGTSDRVAAEWSCLEPPALVPAPPGPLAAAVVVRPGVTHRVDADGVVVDGDVLVDEAASCHAPDGGGGAAGTAVAQGRPPFPCRPVVLLLSADADPTRAAWAGATADALVALDVEGRVASEAPDVPTTRTRPCLPTRQAVEALRPEVVVALDPVAEIWAESWCAPLRGTTVVRWDPDLDGVALVPWRLGVAEGRVRATVGPTADPAELAAVVRRLVAGPLPGLPHDAPATVAVSLPGRPRPLRRPPQLAVIDAHGDPAGRRRAEALRDLGIDAGRQVQVVDPAAPAEEVADADLLVVVGAAVPPATAELVATRRAAGLPTVVEVRRADLDRDVGGWPDVVAELRPEAAALVALVGTATFASRLLRHRTVLGPTHRHVLPTPLSLPLAHRVEDLRRQPGPSRPVVGWHLELGDAGDPARRTAEAVAEGLALALGDADVPIEVTGAPGTLPVALYGDDRVSVVAGPPGPEQVRRWSLLLATPGPDDALDGGPAALLLAGALEVPVVWAAPVDAERALVPLPASPPPGAAPDAWVEHLTPLLEDAERRAEAGAALRAEVEGLVAPDAVATLPDRLARRAEATT